MKILHVITSLETGGAETLVVNLMPHFRNMGCEVGIVVFNGNETSLMKRLQMECPECRIYKLGRSYYNLWYIIKLIFIMRHYDVIHTHNSSPQLFAAIANLFSRKKLVTTEHSTNNRKRERGGFLRMLDKWMYRQYDRTICISNIAEEKLRDYLNNDNRCSICTINNGVDVNSICNASPVDKMKTGKFVITMVAGFREAKDQDTLIKAMTYLPKDQYEIWLVGDGIRRPELESLIDKLSLKDNIRLLGVRTDVPQILKTADVVVMSSHWEGLSLSNIEGMAANKPFIASDVVGLREVTNGYGILFPHENSMELAHIIQKLHDDKPYYKEIANKCYDRAKQFDIANMVEAYSNVYQEVINMKNKS